LQAIELSCVARAANSAADGERDQLSVDPSRALVQVVLAVMFASPSPPVSTACSNLMIG
jgi:hypothetical protein